MSRTGIVVFAHGSRAQVANDSVFHVAKRFADEGGYDLVETAFLELAEPTLREAAERLIARGADRIVVLPYFLTLGVHLQRDLPQLAGEVAEAHPGVHIDIQPPLDGHPALLQVLLDRAAAVTPVPTTL